MSDALALRQKAIDGKNWRKTITVTVEGDEYELTIRQLTDSEYLPVYKHIKPVQEEISDALEGDDLGEEDLERLEELQEKDELSEDEKQELDYLEENVGGGISQVLALLSDEGHEAIKEAGKHAVMPDRGDIQGVMEMSPSEQKEEFGDTVRTPEEAKHVLEAELEKMLDESRNLLAFQVGIQAFFASNVTEGN